MDRTKASRTEATSAQHAAVFADVEAVDLAQVYGPRLIDCPAEYAPVQDDHALQDISPDSSDSAALDISELDIAEAAGALDCDQA